MALAIARPRSAWAIGVVVALEVVLGPAEVVEGLQPGGQLLVGEAVDLLQRRRAMLSRGLDRPATPPPRGRARTRPTAISARSPSSTAASSASLPHLQRLLEVHLVEAVHGQLDLERRGLRRRPAGSSSHARVRRAWASSWRPIQCSTAAHRAISSSRRSADSAGSSSIASSSIERQRSSSPTDRSAEASATRSSTWRSRSAAGSSRSAASNHRAARARRAGGGRLAGLEQHRDGGLVALARRLLHVVGALGGGGAAGAQRLGRPRVGGQPPAAAGGLVHRPPHQRVAEDELARHLRRAHEVAVDQVVERGQPLGLRQLRHRGRQVRLERLARHRRAVQQRPRRERQRLELLGERRGHGARHPPASSPAPLPACRSAPDSRPASLARASCSR